jgi:hypothetical protein
MRNRETGVDKDQQKHSIEILPAGYIGRDENTKYQRQVSITDSMRNREKDVDKDPQRHSIEILRAGYIG